MDYSQFFAMRPEVSLISSFLLLFVFDLFAGEKARKHFQTFVCLLMVVHIATILFAGGEPQEVFGGMYLSSPAINIMKSILAIATLLIFMQSGKWLRNKKTAFKQGEFYILTLSTLIGMYFMMSAGNFLMFFIGLELASVPMACLVAFDKNKGHSAEAGAKYILSALFSSGLMLYGISFLYGTVGTLYFDDMVQGITGSPLQIMALVFFFSGMGFKLSLAPFHLWTADVYQGAPTNVSAYLSVVSKGAAAFAVMTILVKVFAPLVVQWQEMLFWVIIATITIGNLFAIRQRHIKRFLAFSSISQAGYIMLGVISGNGEGMTALIYYILVYMAANLAIFGVVSTIEQHTHGKLDIDDYNGLYRTNPKLSMVMMLSLFSLAGIPPFAGFFSKFFIFMPAFRQGFHLLVFIALVNTVVSLFYYLKLVKAMFINNNEKPIEYIAGDTYTRVSLAVCIIGVLVLGVISSVYSTIFAGVME